MLKIALSLVWLAVTVGGLMLANHGHQSCVDSGMLVPGCNRWPEHAGWAIALLGLIMLARTLHSIPFLRKWLGD